MAAAALPWQKLSMLRTKLASPVKAAGVAAVSHFVITFGGVLCAFATRKLVSKLALPDVYVVRKVDYNHVRIRAMHTRSVLARMVITAAILAAC